MYWITVYLGSGIRCLFDPRIRDPGSRIGFFPDELSTINTFCNIDNKVKKCNPEKDIDGSVRPTRGGGGDEAVLLKVHKHDIIFNFWTYITTLYALGQFSKKISILLLRFLPEFRCSNIFAVTEHTRKQTFVVNWKKKISPQFLLWSY